MGWLAEQLKKFRNQQWGLCTYDGICLLRFSASSRFLLSLMMKTNWESKYSRRCTGPHVKNSQKYEHLFTISCTVVALHASLQFEIQVSHNLVILTVTVDLGVTPERSSRKRGTPSGDMVENGRGYHYNSQMEQGNMHGMIVKCV
ncbi:unnamed protein product [Trifolium pratense]|uniref:Uncharacterized protein n=1 Tax=Trifolium pratense TaxID=57577 RepID=A0ACB0LJ32_TRIPR|nr:unnamed protein product [Trifolium pratense]